MSGLSHFFNMMSRFNDNNLYISSSLVSNDRKFAYEHSKAIKSLQVSKPNVLSAKAWINWLSIKPFATLISIVISIIITYVLSSLFIKIAGNLFGF